MTEPRMAICEMVLLDDPRSNLRFWRNRADAINRGDGARFQKLAADSGKTQLARPDDFQCAFTQIRQGTRTDLPMQSITLTGTLLARNGSYGQLLAHFCRCRLEGTEAISELGLASNGNRIFCRLCITRGKPCTDDQLQLVEDHQWQNDHAHLFGCKQRTGHRHA